MKALLLFVCYALGTTLAVAGWSGRVVAVKDGDTLGILREGREVPVRLVEIDAPEKSQAFGNRSKQSLSDLTSGRTVLVKEHGFDKYRRTLSRVVAGDIDVNAEQVRRGMAWAYRTYLTDSSLLTVEAEARAARRGLWADAEPMPPWQFRHPERLPIAGVKTPKQSPAATASTLAGAAVAVVCGSKRFCKDMVDCAEAKRYLSECGLSALDSDQDGTPCEALCKGK